MKKKPSKTKKIGKLKTELDKWFSLYIRLRESDENGITSCFTCGKVANFRDTIQNGHFQSRKHMSTRFNEQNCQPQCIACNMFRQGEQFKFAKNLDIKYGEGKAEELEQLARTILKISRAEYLEQISYYKLIVKNFFSEKQIE